MNIGTQTAATRRRNRLPLSCITCHIRKQKCDRLKPCSKCVLSGISKNCSYATPIQNKAGIGEQRKIAISRQRRIVTGSDVELTTESIRALIETSPGPTPCFDDPNMASFSTEPKDKREDLEFLASAQSFLQGLDDHVRLFPPYPPRRPTSPHVSSGLTYGLQYGSSLSGSDPFSVLPSVPGEPIPKQLLIRYYIERLAPWMSYLEDDTDEAKPRLAWLPFALRHKALFNALLLTSAVHLNRRRPLRDPAALIWFKVETIRNANENMAKTTESAASDEQIMVALVLLYFNIGTWDIDEYEIHLEGIHQMLKIRGGIQTLGMRGMVKNWLAVCYGPWKDDWVSPSLYLSQ